MEIAAVTAKAMGIEAIGTTKHGMVAKWGSDSRLTVSAVEDMTQDMTISQVSNMGEFFAPLKFQKIMCKQSLDYYYQRPPAMQAYLDNYGWNFNRRLCEFAVSKMMRFNEQTGKISKIEPMNKEMVDQLLTRFGVKLEKETLHNHVFVANMGKADFYKSSIPDEHHLALYVKDTVDDVDAPEGAIMRRWYVSMVAAGEPIEWSEML